MKTSGSLKEREASELLQWVHDEALTGALHFANGSVRKSLYFDAGRIVASSSSTNRERLGTFLVGRGLITEFELGKAIELQEDTGLMIGAILVSIGSLSEAALRELLAQQCTEIVYDLLTWTDGSFAYEDRGGLPRGLVPAEIDVGPVLLAGVKRLEEWMRIRDRIPSLRAIPVSIRALDDCALDANSRRILGLIDDRRSVEDIWLESHATEFALYSALVGACERGELKLVVPPASSATRSEPPPEPTVRMVSVADLLDCAATANDDGDPDLAERYLAAARGLAGDDVTPDAPAREIASEVVSWFDHEPPAGSPGPDAVPFLARCTEEFIRIDLTPQQSFLLSRIDGRTTLGELLRISPMSSDEANAAVAELVEAGHIRF